MTIASTKQGALPVRVLATNVTGSHCDSGFTIDWAPADWGLAIDDAIRSVPGADAMSGVSFSFERENYLLYSRWCAKVTGSAGVFK